MTTHNLVVLGLEVTTSGLLGLSSLVTLTVIVSGASVLTAAAKLGAGSLLVSDRDNIRGNVQPGSKVLNTGIGESVVVVLP